jgi:gliding motility-associated-like protein
VIVTVNPLPTVSIACDEADSTLCFGEDVVLTASGNADTYLWDNSVINATAFTPTITNDYIVTATNTTTGCQDFDTITVTVNPLPNVMANTNDVDSAVCFGDSLYLFGSGNADTYTWDLATDGAYFIPASTSDYIVTGTITATGCESTDTTSITVNSLPSIDNVIVTDVTNCPSPDGSLDIVVSGGTPSYQYSIDAGSTFITTNPFTGLNGGTYNIVVQDANLCIDTSSATIVNPSAPVIDSTLVVDLLCNGDNTGGIIIYSAGAVSYSIDNGSNTQVDSSFTGLAAGNYTLWISDAGSCITIGNATVNEPTVIELDSLVTAAICGNTGSAQVIATGGTLPFSYEWSTTETTETISNLAAATYICTVTDLNSCIETISVIVPDAGSVPYVVFTNMQDVLCFGGSTGSITAVLNNTNTPYTYTWSHNASLNDSIANNLSIGEYYVTIFDSYGCSANDSITITQPSSAIDVSIIDYVDPLCYDGATGSISVSATGGTPTYSFSWSNGSLNQDLTNLNAANYILVVTDANSCTETVSQTLTNPTQIQLSDSIYTDNYYGAIQITPIGGTPDYAYLWSNGQINDVVSNLFAGDYTVTVTDANGCTVENYYKIDIELIIPSVITPNDDGKNDKFRIININAFEEANIKVFSRWGDVIFDYAGTGIGYEDESKQWDGTFNGKEIPMGSYVYIIDLKNEEDPYTGTVTIVR